MKYSRLLKADIKQAWGLDPMTFMQEAFDALYFGDANRFQNFIHVLPYFMDTHELLGMSIPFEYGTTVGDKIQELAEQSGNIEWQSIANELGVGYSDTQNPFDFNDLFNFNF